MAKAKVTEKNIKLILQGSMGKAILALAVPVVINSFLQTMYNLTDTYWLGQLGTNELAAINLVSPLQQIVVNFGSGLTVAGAVLIAQLIGASKKEEAASMASQIFVCAMIFSIICAGVIAIFTPTVVNWLGADEPTAKVANVYLRIVILDMPFLYMVNIFAAIRQAQGDTVSPMFLNLTGILLNVILDPLLMIVIHWGAAGAALATVIAKAVPAMISLVILKRDTTGVRIRLKGFRFEKSKMKSILTVGLPTAIGGSTMQLGFLLMSRNVYVYGTGAMAAYGIGNKVNGLITLPSNGIGSAVATIVGQNIGANQIDRAEKGYKIARRVSVIFLFVGGLILSRPFLSEAIVGLFSTDEEVIAMATDFLSIMALWCFTNGVYNSTSGLFQGSGHTEVTMAVDATRLWVFRFATLYVCENWLHMGVRSIWYSVVVSNALSSVILYVVYRTGLWKKKRV
ncbi:MAG: MATE family efflux transporter [Lachnospiraceae bacterium]